MQFGRQAASHRAPIIDHHDDMCPGKDVPQFLEHFIRLFGLQRGYFDTGGDGQQLANPIDPLAFISGKILFQIFGQHCYVLDGGSLHRQKTVFRQIWG